LYANPHVADIPGNVQLFCIAGWISPLIPDSADIGAYSKSVQSRIYKVPGAALRCAALRCAALRCAGRLGDWLSSNRGHPHPLPLTLFSSRAGVGAADAARRADVDVR
jgi:hypothetical protein